MPFNGLQSGSNGPDRDDDLGMRHIVKTINANAFGAFLCSAIAWLTWPSSNSYFHQYLLAYILVFGGVMCTIAALKAVRQLRLREKLRDIAEKDGAALHSARWATRGEMHAAGMMPTEPTTEPLAVLHDGTVIFAPPKIINTKIVAPPGAGKTSAALVGQVMHHALLGKDTLIIADFKTAEIASQCVRPLEEEGVECIVTDDLRVTTLKSTPVNWLSVLTEAVKQTPLRAAMVARGLALALLPEPPNDQKNTYWRASPRMIVTYAALHLATHDPERCRPGTLYRLLASNERLNEALDKDAPPPVIAPEVESAEVAEGESAPPPPDEDDVLADMALQIIEMRDGVNSNYAEHITAARRMVELYETGGILHEAGMGAEFKYSDIRKRPMVVFLVGSQRDVAVTGKHAAMHLRNFIEAAKATGSIKTRFILDEFTNSPLQALVEDLTTLRGTGGRVVIAAGAESEISRKFGRDSAKTIDGVCEMRIFMSVTDFAEADRLSRLLGNGVHVSPTYNWSDSDDRHNETIAVHGRPLMTPAEILAMPRDEMLILINGLRPIRARKLFQNQISPFCNMLDPNPIEGGKLPPDPIIHIDYGRKQ